MSGVTGKPRQTRLHVLLLAVKSHKKRLGCGHIVDTLTTICTLYRCLIVDELAHKQVTEVIRAVFLLKLVEVKQGAATGERVLNGDNLPPHRAIQRRSGEKNRV